LIWRRTTPKLGLAIVEEAAAAINSDCGGSCNSHKARLCFPFPKPHSLFSQNYNLHLFFLSFPVRARDLQTIHNLIRQFSFHTYKTLK